MRQSRKYRRMLPEVSREPYDHRRMTKSLSKLECHQGSTVETPVIHQDELTPVRLFVEKRFAASEDLGERVFVAIQGDNDAQSRHSGALAAITVVCACIHRTMVACGEASCS